MDHDEAGRPGGAGARGATDRADLAPGAARHLLGDKTALGEVDPRTIDPPYDAPGYRSSTRRSPRHPLLVLPPSVAERAGPLLGEGRVGPLDHDLTRQHPGEPIGERIVVEGRLSDGDGRPIAGQLIELWQANAAGRYAHHVDDHRAPLDPNFSGTGRCVTGPDGRYRFVTIRPGEYPWGNHHNAWRPAHLHFSVFGRAFVDRLVTQMYFPGDPLFAYDPIFNSVNDPIARQAMVAAFDLRLTEPAFALGYRFDIVVGGPRPTPLEDER
ncbi:MAG: protocatechuate 3,4-dioxygenase subunit beta [Actinomycetota bacterium]|nr:protocatechuate 3,4-dioxygenase subunit beta [Actinomycetota bacterium]